MARFSARSGGGNALAVWPLMKEGFRTLVKAHPTSDTLLNAFARFACLGQDRNTYLELRPRIELHRATVVRTQKTSIESCDKEFSPSLPSITTASITDFLAAKGES